MLDSPEPDFKKILDQSMYTYIPEKLSGLEEGKPILKTRVTEIGRNLKPVKLGLVTRLRPVVEYTAISEMIVGVTLIILLFLNPSDYDKLYATEATRLISLMTLGGSFSLVFNAILLMTALKWNKKKVMWTYILMSTMLWVYLFVLSVMKIHFALLVIERDTYKVVIPHRRLFISNACSLGIATMLGSVTHFIGNVAVFTYYNLKYIQPMLFSCGP